jgi:hypothetical protein
MEESLSVSARRWSEWSNLSEVEFLSIELPAHIVIRGWGWRETFQGYIDSLALREGWWSNVNLEKIREVACSLRDFRPDIKVIDEKRVRVWYKGNFRTVVVQIPSPGRR